MSDDRRRNPSATATTRRARPVATPRSRAGRTSRIPGLRTKCRARARAARPSLHARRRRGRGAQGETIWQVAKRHGTDIPHLCYAPEPGYRPDGNCRACMVEIEGERVLAASCIRTPPAGMKVKIAVRARQDGAQDGVRAAGRRPAGRATRSARSGFEVLELGRPHRRRDQPLARARAHPRPTAAIRRWRSTSTPASSAISASAPAAKCRSTT